MMYGLLRSFFNSLTCPVLGICYGMQTMAEQLGGKVASKQHIENLATVEVSVPSQNSSRLLDGIFAII